MKTVLRSTVTLTAAQGLGYIISLAEIAILARGLGPLAFGELVWIQATALLASLFVDYGFNLSASREIASKRDDAAFLKQICGNVFLAKTYLLVGISLLLLLAYAVTNPVSKGMALAGFLYFVGFGLSPFWYFQGRERMGRAIAFEIAIRLTALAALFVYVHTPDDKLRALMIMGLGSLTCTVGTIAMCRFEVGRFKCSIAGAMAQLQHSTPFFLYKGSAQLIGTAGTTALGAIAGKTAVGIFAPADKVVKAVTGLAIPLFNAFYPHLSRLFLESPEVKRQQSRLLVFVTTSLGLLAATSLLFAGPWIISTLLGTQYAEASELLQVMVWIIPLRLLNQTLGFAVLLPAQRERETGMANLCCTILTLTVASGLALFWGAMGFVIGLLIGEVLLVLMQTIISMRDTT
jgi:polysaccharide transporter, PST family